MREIDRIPIPHHIVIIFVNAATMPNPECDLAAAIPGLAGALDLVSHLAWRSRRPELRSQTRAESAIGGLHARTGFKCSIWKGFR